MGIVDPSSTVILEYNFTVGLSDHTGTIAFCHLLSEVAESLVGCKVSFTTTIIKNTEVGLFNQNCKSLI